MIIEPNSKLVMIGDSITDCERARPIGEGLFGALGKGYVSLLDAFLTARYPAQRIRVINMGISGNTVRDLQSRWQSDVLDLRPDWLSICIGINDVWHHFDLPSQPERPVPLDEFTQSLDELLSVTRPSVKGLILMTPYFIEPNRAEPMRKLMDQYGSAVRQLAEKYNAHLVDTQAAFDAVLTELHPMTLAWDRVHPTHAGHIILALAFLEALGYKFQ
jgi:lysophospholipase L1-like esterase